MAARTALLLLTGIALLGAEPSLQFENQSQYTLLELRIHDGPSYAAAENILGQPLDIGATVSADAEGPAYITFFREKFHRGPILAFTMPEPIVVREGQRYRITMFDQSFRVVLEEPAPAESAGCSCSGAR
jgi:hypothetical protein